MPIFPRLYRLVPEGKSGLFHQYLGNLTVHLDSKYPVEREMLTGCYDPETALIIERFVKKGDVCMDIGANIGAITLELAQRVGKVGFVYAFEPGKENCRRLTTNLELNDSFATRVRTVQLGLGQLDLKKARFLR